MLIEFLNGYTIVNLKTEADSGLITFCDVEIFYIAGKSNYGRLAFEVVENTKEFTVYFDTILSNNLSHKKNALNYSDDIYIGLYNEYIDNIILECKVLLEKVFFSKSIRIKYAECSNSASSISIFSLITHLATSLLMIDKSIIVDEKIICEILNLKRQFRLK